MCPSNNTTRSKTRGNSKDKHRVKGSSFSTSPSTVSKKEQVTPPVTSQNSVVPPTIPIIPTELPLIVASATGTKLMYDRTLWVIMNLVGKIVEIQVKTGEYYEGILHSTTTDKGLGAILKMAKKKEISNDKKQERPIDTLIIYPVDLVQLYAKDVTFDNPKDKDFATDIDISGSSNNRKERQLQPWVSAGFEMDSSLELNGEKEDWDQFEVNKKLFGVHTTYSEEFYTTPLDRDSRFYKEKQHEVERIASEIEGKVSSNPHILEERGHKIEADNDEEERYSSVIRDNPNQTEKYIPPQRRKQCEENNILPRKEISMEKETEKEQEILKTETTDSSDNVESPKNSVRVQKSLLSPGNERLRVRQHLVNEKYKNSTPVVQKDDKDFPTGNITRSPLLSPLIGDARSINALSLEPMSPKLGEKNFMEFLNFSLNSKKQSARDETTARFKEFSESIKKITVENKFAISSTHTVDSKKAEIQIETFSKSKIEETTVDSKCNLSEDTKIDTKLPADPPKNIEKKLSNESTESTTDTTNESKPKLNPKAKIFKPMSANAIPFTPSVSPLNAYIFPQQIIREEESWGTYGRGYREEDPYTYPQYQISSPVFSVPYGPIPAQTVYPTPMRIPYGSSLIPTPQFGQTLIYSQSPQAPQTSSRPNVAAKPFVPSSQSKSMQPVHPYNPNYIIPSTRPNIAYPQTYYRPPESYPRQFYDNLVSLGQETKDEEKTIKFSVPNSDVLPHANNNSPKI